MRALVMAAGLGTRLKPLTDSTPKPLVHVGARPMLAYVLEQLAGQGVSEAIMNIHYFPEQMRSFAYEWNRLKASPRLELQDESALLLDSGGAVALAAEWLFEKSDTALICNADVLANPNFTAFRQVHARLRDLHGVECTMAVLPHEEVGRKYHGIRVDPNGLIKEFVNKTGTPDSSLVHFPGYYLIDKKAVARLPMAGEVFCIKQKLWKPLAAEGKLGAFRYEDYYLDLGTPADLREAEAYLKSRSDLP
jgi:NDP-sugar pyrophosphorylase family protein